MQYVPESNGKELVSVGASGFIILQIVVNSGNNYLLIPSLFTIRFIDRNTAIAAGKNKMIRIQFQKIKNPK